MRSSIKFLLPALLASALISACGSSSSSTSSAPAQPVSSSSGGSSSAASVKSASNSSLGSTVLVDAKGLTLYSLSGERAGKFICTSTACVHAWHPLTVASGGKPSGSVSSLGVVKRPDGTEQVTYKGMPLYTFVQDKRAGQANGQGIKDVGVWNAVKTGAAGSATSSTSSSSSSSSGGGGGSSYAY